MIRWLYLLACAAFLTSCGDAYPKLKELGGGYVYWMATDDLIFIVKGDPRGSNSSIIPESIDRIAKQGDWVFGHVTPYPDELAGAKTPESARGYFHLNITNNAYKIGLSENEWLKDLAAQAVEDPLGQLRPHL